MTERQPTPFIRDAAPGDELEVARIHVLSWQVAYRGLLPDAYLDGLYPEDRARRYTFAKRDPDSPQTIIALEDGSLRGFATVAPVREPTPRAEGELCALYVAPNHWGEGWGAALVGAARARLSSLGFDSAVLWVLVGNTRAGRFYERDGWRMDGGRRADRVWELTVEETRFRRALP